MYILLVLALLLTVGGGLYLHRLLFWAFEETREEAAWETTGGERFYRSETWTIFRRLFPQRQPLLGYRRDKKGRFRKMR